MAVHSWFTQGNNNAKGAVPKTENQITIFLPNLSPKKVKGGNTLVLTMRLKDEALLRKYFDRLAKDGKVLMPISQFFWSDAYGIVVDKFGIEWKFNLEK